MTEDPIITLGIDNCFASKRWTKPESWCALVAELGLRYIEASADTECDPLYMGSEYTADWIQDVRCACEKHGVQIANLYSGHGTYATLGLSHWDERVRERFREQWIKPQIDTAAAFGAGIGFFAHAFDETVLQEREQYEQALNLLCRDLADIAAYAASRGIAGAGVEQMYSPHQPPWTIESTQALLRRIYALRNAPFYVTLDVGHMNGQRHFAHPTEDSIRQTLLQVRRKKAKKRIWMGSRVATQAFWNAVAGRCTDTQAVRVILNEAEKTPYLFAEHCDTDPYQWLAALGCLSPIVHLQQSDGNSSPHWPFDAAHNAKGIIDGEKLLRALALAYEKPRPDMPPLCKQITLTLEPFIGTAEDPYDAVDKLRESVDYWRSFVPRDGMHLSELIQELDQKQKR